MKHILLATFTIGCANQAALAAGQAPAKSDGSVKLKPAHFMTKRYEGSLANKNVVMLLSENLVGYTGAYAYVPPVTPGSGTASPKWIDIEGRKSPDGTVTLVEKWKDKVTGQFTGKIAGNAFSGAWSSPQGKTMNFVANAADAGAVSFGAEYSAKKIRKIQVYRGEKPSQSFPASLDILDSPNDLSYENGDYNFDGYPDFSLSIPKSGRVYLLFDPATKGYAAAPASLNAINVTGIDHGGNALVEEWSGSDERGMNVYKYTNGKYCLVEKSVVSGPAEKARISKKRYPVSPCKAKQA